MHSPHPCRVSTGRKLTGRNWKRTVFAAIAAAVALTIGNTAAALAAGNSHELAPHAHQHVNWLFTKAGNYQATFTISVPYRDAQGKAATVETEATLNFSAGTDGAGTVTDGHYDFGPQVDDQNQVSAMLKNPSGNPEDPANIWFGLTDTAHQDLPDSVCKGLGLNPQCSGWVIPQNQKPGIPWVGFNTQDAKLHNIMSGAATFTLTSLTGPGDMYVWQDGSFGGTSGTWFAAGGDGSDGFEEENPESENQDQDTAGAKPPSGAQAPHGEKNKTGERDKKPAGAQPPAGGASDKAKTPAPTPGGTQPGGSQPGGVSEGGNSPHDTGVNPAIFSGVTAGNSTAEPCYPIPTGQRFALPLSTHVHPNWVFTQPGNYQVGIRQSARIGGQIQSADTILNFTVGGAGNANEGHFDLGAKVENGRLVATVKDDRSAGGTWVNPRSLVFGLGTGAKAQLPAGLEFLAPAGTTVWMIGSTQASGVPWLGANTQHPSLVAATAEPVTWELLSFRGPAGGRMAVFTSGNFGQIVGQRWFTAPTSASHVGRTASGKYCRLDGGTVRGASFARPAGGLAATGLREATLPLAVFAAGITLLGFALFRRARDAEI